MSSFSIAFRVHGSHLLKTDYIKAFYCYIDNFFLTLSPWEYTFLNNIIKGFKRMNKARYE